MSLRTDRPPAPPLVRCSATLRHAHGVTRCLVEEDHAEHWGLCDCCWEDGFPAELRWTGGPGRTEWTT